MSVPQLPEAGQEDVHGGVHQVFVASPARPMIIKIPSTGQSMQVTPMVIQPKFSKNLSTRKAIAQNADSFKRIESSRRASVYAGLAAGVEAAGVNETENPEDNGGDHQGGCKHNGAGPCNTTANKAIFDLPEAGQEDVDCGIHRLGEQRFC